MGRSEGGLGDGPTTNALLERRRQNSGRYRDLGLKCQMMIKYIRISIIKPLPKEAVSSKIGKSVPGYGLQAGAGYGIYYFIKLLLD